MRRALEDLIASWDRIAKHAARYNLTLDDWLNDLDLRDMIDRRIADLSMLDPALRSRLDAADRAFRDATAESTQSLWGPTAGAEHRVATHWWYFRYPSSPGIEMRRDLRRAGVLPKEED